MSTYGPDVVYDDFIANFTASAWNPDDWVDLFVNAGAKYFVLVTKHHDGFALVCLRSQFVAAMECPLTSCALCSLILVAPATGTLCFLDRSRLSFAQHDVHN